jgi:hypothetical protein
MKKFLLTCCVAIGLGTGLSADNITFSSINGGAAIGSPKLNLDDLDLGNDTQWIDGTVKVSFTGTGEVVQGAAGGLYAAPFVSGSNGIGFGAPDQAVGADTTKYLSTGIGSIVLSFTTNQTYFGLLWGSVDNYNTLSFYDNNDLVGSFTGTQIWASANGNQDQQGTFYVNFTNTDGTFNKVVASSTQYAFELDNIAYKGPTSTTHGVPDGGNTVAMLGFVLAGLAWVRRKA